jgi:hypothetical protein
MSSSALRTLAKVVLIALVGSTFLTIYALLRG